VTLEISFKNYTPAQMPQLSEIGAASGFAYHPVVGKDMAEVSDFVDMVDGYSPDLAP